VHPSPGTHPPSTTSVLSQTPNTLDRMHLMSATIHAQPRQLQTSRLSLITLPEHATPTTPSRAISHHHYFSSPLTILYLRLTALLRHLWAPHTQPILLCCHRPYCERCSRQHKSPSGEAWEVMYYAGHAGRAKPFLVPEE
jgi:hypothetical protein